MDEIPEASDISRILENALEEERRASKLLQECNYCVADGEELMDFLHYRGKYAAPNLSPHPELLLPLSICRMPKKDGREARREMKANPAFNTIPVVIPTTSKTEQDIEHRYGLGANSYVTKPVSFDCLVEVRKVMIEYWLQIVMIPAGTNVC